MVGDLEYRGHVRPSTEVFNLVGNHDSRDIMRVTFLWTCAIAPSHGGGLLRRERQAKSAASVRNTFVLVYFFLVSRAGYAMMRKYLLLIRMDIEEIKLVCVI